jgi:hypothetical protein
MSSYTAQKQELPPVDFKAGKWHMTAATFTHVTTVEFLGEVFSVGDRLCDLLVRVPGYRSRGPGSIPGLTRFSEK